MALEIQFAPVLSPGNAGSNDEVKIAFALYRDGEIKGIEDFNGSQGTSHLNIWLFDEASGSTLATYTAADLTEATATNGTDHYWAEMTVSGLAGAQVLGFRFDVEWNDAGIDPVETLTTTRFYPINTSA